MSLFILYTTSAYVLPLEIPVTALVSKNTITVSDISP